jgi:3-oxoacyl-[acyl-carrier protein] reductase
MSNELTAKTALVTGAGRGIGRAIALAYAAAGMKVVCSARTSSEIDAVVQSIKDDGGEAPAVACDVTDPARVEAMCAAAHTAFGSIDILVVNAGMASESIAVADADTDVWRQVIELNLVAAMDQCRAAIPYLRHGGGKILFTGSGIGRTASPGKSAYACSKAGVAMLCRVLARELRDDNIAVNEIVPGPVRTRMTGIDEEREGRDEQGAPILSVPGEWIKNPQDVAPLALYLAGLPNNGPTGQVFSLAGRDLGRI